MKNKTAVIIGKSIIRRLFDYYKDVGLDDETEFFPYFKDNNFEYYG